MPVFQGKQYGFWLFEDMWSFNKEGRFDCSIMTESIIYTYMHMNSHIIILQTTLPKLNMEVVTDRFESQGKKHEIECAYVLVKPTGPTSDQQQSNKLNQSQLSFYV